MVRKNAVEKKVCLACPPSRNKRPLREFYKSNSPMHSDGFVPWCKNCIVKNSLDENGNIDVKKFKNVLRQIDKPFYMDYLRAAENECKKRLGESGKEIKNYGEKIIKRYMKNVQSLRQVNDKTYSDSEESGFSLNPKLAITEEQFIKELTNKAKDKKKRKWSKSDTQNKKYVISVLGYDPFEDVYLSEEDRRYGFNILAGYCDTEGIREDGHKIQGVIEISILYIQCRKITESINKELSHNILNGTEISKLVSSKTSLLSAIATIAKDNNIASNYNKNSKQGKDSLTSKMKEMEENGFRDIQVNLFDIKTSEAFKQIDEISNSNISKQLSLDSGDYNEIIKDQRELIKKYEEKTDFLEEENRKLKNRLIEIIGTTE